MSERKIKVGDTVRYYVNESQYITGEVVETCADNTAWVRHSNGQERNYSMNVLEMDNE